MLYLSLIFILLGTSVVLVATLLITYFILTGGEKINYLQPRTWPKNVIIWSKIIALGLLTIIIGMLWALLGT
ncbi:MAG: hypothetical protein VR69_01545 [Peptococcaceae bacterium BRH_c4b]|nr:MAG: hypothetical protein VR69_01545 [Peptococcaceae bacterium BRH_c4b]